MTDADNPRETRRPPLARFTVLDLTRVRAGPTAARQLADWGANVIKIEAPPAVDKTGGMGGARHGPDFQNLHRNKRGITLNLKSPAGVDALKRMVRQADVLVENYRPDVKHRLGVDYDTLAAINPRLVYASISGFGEDGPYRMRPGFDQIAQGMGGLMSITGAPGEGPMRVGIPVADLTAGLFAAMGVFIALLEREESGKGQWVQSSLLAAQISMLDFQAARWLMAGDVPPQAGNNHPTSIPTGVYATADGHINVAASGDQMWQRLCTTLGCEPLADHADYATGELRSRNRDALNATLAEYFATRDSASWIEALNEVGVPCGPINAIDGVFADPQVQHLGMARPLSHPVLGETHVVNNPIRLSHAPAVTYTATPEPGEHTDGVMAEFGFSAEEVAALRAEGAV